MNTRRFNAYTVQLLKAQSALSMPETDLHQYMDALDGVVGYACIKVWEAECDHSQALKTSVAQRTDAELLARELQARIDTVGEQWGTVTGNDVANAIARALAANINNLHARFDHARVPVPLPTNSSWSSLAASLALRMAKAHRVTFH